MVQVAKAVRARGHHKQDWMADSWLPRGMGRRQSQVISIHTVDVKGRGEVGGVGDSRPWQHPGAQRTPAMPTSIPNTMAFISQKLRAPWARQVAQQVKALATEPGDPSLITEIYTVEGENRLLWV